MEKRKSRGDSSNKRSSLQVYVPIGRRKAELDSNSENFQPESENVDSTSSTNNDEGKCGKRRERKVRTERQVYVPRAKRLEMEKQQECSISSQSNGVSSSNPPTDMTSQKPQVESQLTTEPASSTSSEQNTILQTDILTADQTCPLNTGLNQTDITNSQDAAVNGPSNAAGAQTETLISSTEISSSNELVSTFGNKTTTFSQSAQVAQNDENGAFSRECEQTELMEIDSLVEKKETNSTAPIINKVIPAACGSGVSTEDRPSTGSESEGHLMAADDEFNVEPVGDDKCTSDVPANMESEQLPAMELDSDENDDTGFNSSEKNGTEKLVPDSKTACSSANISTEDKPTDDSSESRSSNNAVENGPALKSEEIEPATDSNKNESIDVGNIKPIDTAEEAELVADTKITAESAVTETAEDSGNDSDSWETKFADDGECLDDEALKELTKAIGKVKVKKPVIDYLTYVPTPIVSDSNLEHDKFSHLLELYGFSASLKTQDLLNVFKSHVLSEFSIKWIDDTHAIGICCSAAAAQEALSCENSIVKCRPISQASKPTRDRVKDRPSEFMNMLPPKERPQTNAMTARRLVTNSLGLSVKVSQEQRQKEREQLRNAKARKGEAAVARRQIWEGDMDNSGSGSDDAASPTTTRKNNAGSPVATRKSNKWDGKIGRCAMDNI